ncbi:MULTISPECIES: hypothetical protein [Actinopolyspora]|uniref:GAF domain-containing protein n=1 Tax=Actinopolyspora saharensis TaxID=995062 RepID=A0A1H0ZGC7_9ACTN|nr:MULTISPECIES: hypothetical protein [Actinopolyspora]NHD15808.1 GAF domain-containing protein [Actinopolyspora sp. BKK2]NHE74978.1 GAF domain-containing protein [Actinopolyspora sp. BKK1]SDQ26434.1 hypothetical protein SAMN04489718_1027 [Actinopolyspora saharensis]
MTGRTPVRPAAALLDWALRNSDASTGEALAPAEVRHALDRLVTVLPGVDLAGLSRSCGGHGRTLAATDRCVHRLDGEQHNRGDGPLVEAVRSGRAVRAEITEVRTHWPSFVRGAREEHVHGFLIVPLTAPAPGRTSTVTVSCYTRTPRALDAVDEHDLSWRP